MRGFLTGIAAGLAIGYLTAPRSGKETRDQLAASADEQTKGLKGQWDKTVSQVKETFENVKSQAGIFADKAEDKVDEYKNEAKSAYDQSDVASDYNQKVDDLADDTKAGVDKAEDALKLNY